MIEAFNSNSHRKPPSLSSLVEGKDNGLEDDFDFGVEGVAIHEEVDDDIVLPFIDQSTSDQLVRLQTAKQLKERQYSIGWHHGRMNPLPSSWQYPAVMTLI